MFDPINEALSDEIEIPFVQICAPDDPVPDSAAIHVAQDGYCLKADANLDDILQWFDTAKTEEQTSELRLTPDPADQYQCASED